MSLFWIASGGRIPPTSFSDFYHAGGLWFFLRRNDLSDLTIESYDGEGPLAKDTSPH